MLARRGLSRWRDLEPADPVVRQERDAQGERLHIGISKLGKFTRRGRRITGDPQPAKSRGVGWEVAHVCVGDHSRLGFRQVPLSERKEDAAAFLKAALARHRELGIKVERAMTENGSRARSRAFAKACVARGLKHIRTRPNTPKTSGEVERFIRSSLREWLLCANGPPGAPVRRQNGEQPNCRIGCTTTIGIVDTPGQNHPSADQAWM